MLWFLTMGNYEELYLVSVLRQSSIIEMHGEDAALSENWEARQEKRRFGITITA